MTDSMSPSASLSIVLPLPVPVGDSGMMADCRCWWHRDRPLGFTVDPPPANRAGEWQTGSHDEWAALVLRLQSPPTLGGIRDALICCIEAVWNQAPAYRIEALLEECGEALDIIARRNDSVIPAAFIGESVLKGRRPIAERGIPPEGEELFAPWVDRMWWRPEDPDDCAATEKPVDGGEGMVSGSLRAWSEALLGGSVEPDPALLAARLQACALAASFFAPAEILQHALDQVIASLDRLATRGSA